MSGTLCDLELDGRPYPGRQPSAVCSGLSPLSALTPLKPSGIPDGASAVKLTKGTSPHASPCPAWRTSDWYSLDIGHVVTGVGASEPAATTRPVSTLIDETGSPLAIGLPNFTDVWKWRNLPCSVARPAPAITVESFLKWPSASA